MNQKVNPFEVDPVGNRHNKYARTFRGSPIDAYDVLRAFNITEPELQHAIKKLLRNGSGSKPQQKDVDEAKFCLEKWQENQQVVHESMLEAALCSVKGDTGSPIPGRPSEEQRLQRLREFEGVLNSLLSDVGVNCTSQQCYEMFMRIMTDLRTAALTD